MDANAQTVEREDFDDQVKKRPGLKI